jgi:hypothetical protein
VKITFFQCNAADNDQRFRIVTVGGVQTYSTPGIGKTGMLVNDNDRAITMAYPTDNSGVGWSPVDYDNSVQRFQPLYKGNTFLLQRLGTTLSLSSSSLDPNLAVNTNIVAYSTGEGRWQNFGFVSLGNGKYLIKWAWDPTKCIGESSTLSGTRLLNCDQNQAGQRWSLRDKTRYELMIAAKTTTVPLAIYWNNGGPDVGHTSIAVIPVSESYENGNPVNSKYWMIQSKVTTYSAWPSFQCTFTNCINDWNFFNEVISKKAITGTLSDGSSFSLRRQQITLSSPTFLSTKAYTVTGCSRYGPGTDNDFCTCVDQSTRLWKAITGEDFTPYTYFGNVALEMSPNIVFNKIQNANTALNTNGYSWNGQMIQIN